MLQTVQKGWFSYDFDVFDRTGARIAAVDLANWRENASQEEKGAGRSAPHLCGYRSGLDVL